MNRLYKLVLLTFLISLFLVFDTMAQGFNSKNKYWSIGATLNIMNYVGDVDPGPSFISPGLKFTKYNLGAVVMRRISPRVSLRGAFSFGKIGGSDWANSTYSTAGGDIYRKERNLTFKNNIYELKGDVVIDLIEHRGRYQKRPDFVPYVFVGLAYFHHNPKETTDLGLGDGTQTYTLKDYHTEGQGLKNVDHASKAYSLNQIALPIGLGMRYKLSKQFDLAFEIGWRFTTTDYLDDAGGYFVDKTQLYNAMGGGKKAEEAVLLSDMSWQHNGDGQLPGHYNLTPNIVDAVDPGHQDHSTMPVGGGPNGDRRAKASNRKDAYIITGLHLMYIIPTKVICPKFR